MIDPNSILTRIAPKLASGDVCLTPREERIVRALVQAVAEELSEPQPGESEHLYQRAREMAEEGR